MNTLIKQRDILYLNREELRNYYTNYLPTLYNLIINSKSFEDFKKKLSVYINDIQFSELKIIPTLKTLLKSEGSTVYELSQNKNIQITTFKNLYDFILNNGIYKNKIDVLKSNYIETIPSGTNETKTPENIIPKENDTESKGRTIQSPEIDNSDIYKSKFGNPNTDLYIDLFYLFRQLEFPYKRGLTKKNALSSLDSWPSSTEEIVKIEIEENVHRIMHLLINKIDKRKHKRSKYIFPSNIDEKNKLNLIKSWWKDHSFHLVMAIRDPDELNIMLNYSLTKDTMKMLHDAQDKGIPFFVTPYYLSLLSIKNNGFNDYTIRSYIIYTSELVETFGKIKAWEKEDEVISNEPNAAGWILPEGHNIHRRYPEVAILIPDTLGRMCGGLCASCQRMYDFQNKHLNFDMEKLKPKDSWNKKLQELMTFFENDKSIKDILITGGDAFMSSNQSLKNIFDEIILMAIRKKEANKNRKIKYAEIKRIRLGTRLTVYLPMRITDDLVDLLRDTKERASKVGIESFVIQTHFQSPLELTSEATLGIKKILSSGWIITNQLVFNVGASRIGHTTSLRRKLNLLGVLTYYTFIVKGFNENHAVYTPISRSLHEKALEKVYGKLTKEESEELLVKIKLNNADVVLPKFIKDHNLPFLATDRTVLNLPGIGKSMTCSLIGYLPSGNRILEFDHDHTREHSKIIKKMGKIFIVENKSIAEYLRQLVDLGENIEHYRDIWQYTIGKTEKLFKLYKV